MKSFWLFIQQHSEWLYNCGLFLACTVTVILRQVMQLNRKSWRVRLSEAFLCSMLSSSIIQLVKIFTELPPEVAFPISVFVGFLGTDVVRALILAVFKSKVTIDDATK